VAPFDERSTAYSQARQPSTNFGLFRTKSNLPGSKYFSAPMRRFAGAFRFLIQARDSAVCRFTKDLPGAGGTGQGVGAGGTGAVSQTPPNPQLPGANGGAGWVLITF